MENNINPNKFYTPKEIADESLFPWVGHEKTIKTWIASQIEAGNAEKYGIVLKPGKSENPGKDGHGNRYFVSGSGIQKIIEDFQSGKLFEREDDEV